MARVAYVLYYYPPQDPTGMSFNTINENNGQFKQTKEVCRVVVLVHVRGLPHRGVIVAPVDDFWDERNFFFFSR